MEREAAGGRGRRGSSEREIFLAAANHFSCSGLRTEAGEGSSWSHISEELRGTLFHGGVGSRRRTLQGKGKEDPGIVCRWRGGRPAWTGAGRAVWDFALWIQSHDSLLCPSRLPAFLLAWLVQDPAPGPLLSPLYPQMPSFTPASPFQEHACFRSAVAALPRSCRRSENERGRRKDGRKELKR